MHYPIHYTRHSPVCSKVPVTHSDAWLNDIFSSSGVFSSFFDDFFKNTSSEVRSYIPALKVNEDEKAYYVDVEVPGVDKKDISLSLQNGVLTIEGKRHQQQNSVDSEGNPQGENYSAFKRFLRLGDHVMEKKITATLEKGILTVTLPKTEKAEVKHITIN